MRENINNISYLHFFSAFFSLDSRRSIPLSTNSFVAHTGTHNKRHSTALKRATGKRARARYHFLRVFDNLLLFPGAAHLSPQLRANQKLANIKNFVHTTIVRVLEGSSTHSGIVQLCLQFFPRNKIDILLRISLLEFLVEELLFFSNTLNNFGVCAVYFSCIYPSCWYCDSR